MRRAVLLGSIVIGLLSCQGSAQAGWDEFKERFCLDFHRNNCWPVPFNLADRQATRAPFLVMANNGWQLQNTLGEFHFDPETNKLNSAGIAKLHWIVTSAPLHRRTVFVNRMLAEEATKSRVDSVQQTVAKLIPTGGMPEVLMSDTPPALSPGFYPDQINRSMRDNIPPPILPNRGTPLGGGGGGGSS